MTLRAVNFNALFICILKIFYIERKIGPFFLFFFNSYQETALETPFPRATESFMLSNSQGHQLPPTNPLAVLLLNS